MVHPCRFHHPRGIGDRRGGHLYLARGITEEGDDWAKKHHHKGSYRLPPPSFQPAGHPVQVQRLPAQMVQSVALPQVQSVALPQVLTPQRQGVAFTRA